MGQKILFFAPIFFAVTYAQSNQTNQTNQPTNQPTNQSTDRPTNQTANRNCLGKSHQPSTLDISTDFWIEARGNKFVLQALNAAMYKINRNVNWKRIVTEVGGTPVTSPNVGWPSSSGAMGTFQYMMETRKIRFGSSLNLFPLATNDTGCINGTEINLGNMIAHEFTQHYGGTPFEAVWVRIDRAGDFWYDITYALSGDQNETNYNPPIDVILSMATKTEKREAEGMVRFTSSYLSQQYGIVLSDQALKKGLTLSTLDNAAYKIAFEIGTTSETFVNKTYANIQVQPCNTFSQKMDLVKMNQSDAVIGDATLIKNWAIRNNKRYLGSVGDFTELAMAVRPAQQPSANLTNQECTMVANPTGSTFSKYCDETKSAFCESCGSKEKCYRLLKLKREGKCCTSLSCCIKRFRGQCRKSFTREGSVKCRSTYVVTFEARGTNKFTEKTSYGIYRKLCGESKKCVDDLLKNPRFKKDQNVTCKVTAKGNIELLDIDDESIFDFSSASYRFISSYSILFLFVWFFSS